jgi:hypothetical protein
MWRADGWHLDQLPFDQLDARVFGQDADIHRAEHFVHRQRTAAGFDEGSMGGGHDGKLRPNVRCGNAAGWSARETVP